jgi:hypothetical protein
VAHISRQNTLYYSIHLLSSSPENTGSEELRLPIPTSAEHWHVAE